MQAFRAVRGLFLSAKWILPVPGNQLLSLQVVIPRVVKYVPPVPLLYQEQPRLAATRLGLWDRHSLTVISNVSKSHLTLLCMTTVGSYRNKELFSKWKQSPRETGAALEAGGPVHRPRGRSAERSSPDVARPGRHRAWLRAMGDPDHSLPSTTQKPCAWGKHTSTFWP